MSSGTPPAAQGEPVRSVRLLVSGKVQGVFFRKYTRATAARLGVTGWVRNLPDGRVEVLAEGTEAQLTQLEAWCHEGSPRAKVMGVVVETDTPAADGVGGGEVRGTKPFVTPASACARRFKTFDILK